MGIQDRSLEKLRERTQPLLESGEQIEHIFPGQTIHIWTGALLVPWWLVNYRVVAVTDRNVVLINAGKVRVRPKEIIARYPLDTPLGPPSGNLMYKFRLGDNTIYVARGMWKYLKAADAARATGS